MSHQSQSSGTLNVWCDWKSCVVQVFVAIERVPQLLGRLEFPPRLCVILHVFESGLWLKCLETKPGLKCDIKCDINCVKSSKQLTYSVFKRSLLIFITTLWNLQSVIALYRKKKKKQKQQKSAYVTTLNIWCFLILSSVSTMYLFDSLDHSGPK